jgi:signal transduction histidine kinase
MTADLHPAAPRDLKARILVVDDDERNAFAATEALKVLGHELRVARSGPDALRLLLAEEFAVILLDLHMPGMDGYETARLIREHPRTRDTPIVFVTAVFRDEAHIFQAYEAGAVDVVFKPVDPFILRSKVAVLVDLYLKTLQIHRQAAAQTKLLTENAAIAEARLAAEMELRQTRERQDAILRSLPVVFTSRARQHPFPALFVSDSIAPLTGFEPSRFIDDPEIGLGRIHPADVDGVVNCLMQASESGAYACEYRWMCADGQYRTFLDQGVWVPGESGGDGEIFGTLLDITDRRRLEEQLSHARKMEAVGQLTGGIAHDFNNLLTVVLGHADLLMRKPEATPIRRQLEAIKLAADRGQTLTRQLLAFARRQALAPEAVDLNQLVSNFLPLVRQAVGDAVTVDWKRSAEPIFVMVDANQLENALLNLAVNARDAMAGSGRIVLQVAGSDGEGVITVADTGCGMSQETRERLFEPFYTTKEVGRGSGLGLSQVYGFIQQSGGRVEIDSTPGEGSTFALRLPLTDQRPQEVRADPGKEDAPRGTERLLIVEDDPSVLGVGFETLQGLGYRCEYAVDAQAALARLEVDQDFDLVFSDVVMPGPINGIDLARRCRASHPGLAVLLTSGYVGDAALQDVQEFDVLEKPYERSVLARRLRAVLDARPGFSGDGAPGGNRKGAG